MRCEPVPAGLGTTIGILLRRTLRSLHGGLREVPSPIRRVDSTLSPPPPGHSIGERLGLAI